LMKKHFLTFVLLLLTVAPACVNQYEVLLRSTDYDLKFRKAIEYFEAKKIFKITASSRSVANGVQGNGPG